MLCVNSYSADQISQAAVSIEKQLAAYRAIPDSPQKADFEPEYLNNMVVILDALFMHRSRTIEKKDGNPMNEVRMVSLSVVQNRSVLALDKSIKYKSENSVLGLSIGDEIRISLPQFEKLADAYFAAIQQTFGE